MVDKAVILYNFTSKDFGKNKQIVQAAETEA